MGSMSLKTVFGHFLLRLSRIKRSQTYVLENFAPPHPTFVMIFGLKMVSREALTLAQKSKPKMGAVGPYFPIDMT